MHGDGDGDSDDDEGLSVTTQNLKNKERNEESHTPINTECTLTLKSLIQFERIMLAWLQKIRREAQQKHIYYDFGQE